MVCDTVSQIFILEQAGIWNGAVCVRVHECLCEAASVWGYPALSWYASGNVSLWVWPAECVFHVKLTYQYNFLASNPSSQFHLQERKKG